VTFQISWATFIAPIVVIMPQMTTTIALGTTQLNFASGFIIFNATVIGESFVSAC
jgi:hypothetical protein